MNRDRIDTALDHPKRVEAAKRLLSVLPTKPTAEVEAVLRNLAEHLKVPLAAATLIDDRDQHFIATNDGPMEFGVRETSHCQYVIAHHGLYLCISDVDTDSVFMRLARNLVGGRPLNAYLGFPLSYDGQRVGAVCVADNRARVWSGDDQYEVLLAQRAIEKLIAD